MCLYSGLDIYIYFRCLSLGFGISHLLGALSLFVLFHSTSPVCSSSFHRNPLRRPEWFSTCVLLIFTSLCIKICLLACCLQPAFLCVLPLCFWTLLLFFGFCLCPFTLCFLFVCLFLTPVWLDAFFAFQINFINIYCWAETISYM